MPVYSGYSNIASATTNPASTPQPQDYPGLRLFLLQPAVLFQAQINQSSFTYPIAEVAYDNVLQGSASAVQPGVTVLFGTTPGADDLGRQRIRKAPTGDTLYFGRSSRGARDGEVDLQDNAYITVLWDARVWAKPPTFAGDTVTGVVEYKDHDIAVGDYGSFTPPVANAGMGFAATIDPLVGKMRVRLPAGHQDPAANLSFATADGATIVSYQWSLPATGVTLVGGYALTDPVIEVDVAPGFYYVALEVTDSNGKTHRARVPIFARDPANDPTISAFEIVEHTITPAGQRLSVRILEDIPASQYPDGTLVMLWDGEPLTPSDRSHMKFIGWHHTDPAQVQATRTGTLREVTLECLDVAGMLDTLPGWPQEIRAEAVRESDGIAATTWGYMERPTLNKYMHYLLHWHSTALEVADWTWAEDGDSYTFLSLQSSGSTLYDQVERVAQSFCPDHHFTCDSRGRLRVVPDPMVQPEEARTAAWRASFHAADYTSLRYTHQRSPRVASLRGAAIQAQDTPRFDENGKLVIPTFFCRSPGTAPGQGTQTEQVHSNQLALSQSDLNIVTGHRYARLNAPDSHFVLTLAQGSTFEIEPAEMVWVQLSIPPNVAAPRGLSFTDARGLVHAIRIRYEHGRTGLLRTVEMEWEREVTGPPAVTEVLPTATIKPRDDWWPPDYWSGDPGGLTPGEEPEPDPFAGNMRAYLAWSGGAVVRTWNIQDASPVWERVDTGITGQIVDAQYVHVDSDTVGVWLLTYDGVWWCGDILATTPVWSLALSTATVAAAEETPPAGETPVRVLAMYNAASEPGYLICAVGPGEEDAISESYVHCSFWHTHDYGQTWTRVDLTDHVFSSLGITSGYFKCHPHGIDIHRSSGTIFAYRATGRIGTQGRNAVFVSDDGGHTFQKRLEIASPNHTLYSGAILAPFPSITDPSYLIRGTTTAAQPLRLSISTDAWVSRTLLTLPSGYSDIASHRPNKRTYDNDHVIAFHRNDADGQAHLLQSLDRGQSWTLLWNPGSSMGPGFRPPFQVNGWPSDINQWVAVRTSHTLTPPSAGILYLTLDNFQTTLDKTGNLGSVLSAWAASDNLAGGFALPKVGPNQD